MPTLVTHGLLSPFLLTRGLGSGTAAGGPPLVTHGLLSILNLWPPFGAAGAVVELPTFEAALRARIKAEVPGLAEVYWDEVASPPAYPYCLINGMGDEPEFSTESGYIDRSIFQFSVVARRARDARTLGVSTWAALLPGEDNPPLEFEGGYEMTRLPGRRQRPKEQPGQGPGGTMLWMYSFDVMWMIGREG